MPKAKHIIFYANKNVLIFNIRKQKPSNLNHEIRKNLNLRYRYSLLKIEQTNNTDRHSNDGNINSKILYKYFVSHKNRSPETFQDFKYMMRRSR